MGVKRSVASDIYIMSDAEGGDYIPILLTLPIALWDG